RLPFSYLANARDILGSAQLQARGFFTKAELPNGRRFAMPGTPFRMADSPWRAGPAPRLGEAGEALTPRPPLPTLGEGEPRSDGSSATGALAGGSERDGDSPSPRVGRGGRGVRA